MGKLRNDSDNHIQAESVLNLTCRHVGNRMASLVMQTLGCEVAALNTVHFSTSRNQHCKECN